MSAARSWLWIESVWHRYGHGPWVPPEPEHRPLAATIGNADDAAHQRLQAAAASRPLVHASRLVVGVSFALVLALLATVWPLFNDAVDPLPGRLGRLRTLVLGTTAHGDGAPAHDRPRALAWALPSSAACAILAVVSAGRAAQSKQ